MYLTTGILYSIFLKIQVKFSIFYNNYCLLQKIKKYANVFCINTKMSML